MDNTISLTFGEPYYGWLPVGFNYKDFQIDFRASNVLNDPIEEIKDVLTQLQNNETKRITFWLEAPAYYFEITKNGNELILTISYSDDFLDKITKPNLLRTIKGSEVEIIEPLRSALKRFEGLTYNRQHWYGFDEEDEQNN